MDDATSITRAGVACSEHVVARSRLVALYYARSRCISARSTQIWLAKLISSRQLSAPWSSWSHTDCDENEHQFKPDRKQKAMLTHWDPRSEGAPEAQHQLVSDINRRPGAKP